MKIAPKGFFYRVLTICVPAVILFAPLQSAALIDVNDPDDICAPAADPCVIDDAYNVLISTPDFGIRAVAMTAGGRLEGNNLCIYCGDFSRPIGSGTMARTIDMDSSFALTVQRACSGKSTIACLTDTACTDGAAVVNAIRCLPSLRSILVYGTLHLGRSIIAL